MAFADHLGDVDPAVVGVVAGRPHHHPDVLQEAVVAVNNVSESQRDRQTWPISGPASRTRSRGPGGPGARPRPDRLGRPRPRPRPRPAADHHGGTCPPSWASRCAGAVSGNVRPRILLAPGTIKYARIGRMSHDLEDSPGPAGQAVANVYDSFAEAYAAETESNLI